MHLPHSLPFHLSLHPHLTLHPKTRYRTHLSGGCKIHKEKRKGTRKGGGNRERCAHGQAPTQGSGTTESKLQAVYPMCRRPRPLPTTVDSVLGILAGTMPLRRLTPQSQKLLTLSVPYTCSKSPTPRHTMSVSTGQACPRFQNTCVDMSRCLGLVLSLLLPTEWPDSRGHDRLEKISTLSCTDLGPHPPLLCGFK